jgi:hypothetical protein
MVRSLVSGGSWFKRRRAAQGRLLSLAWRSLKYDYLTLIIGVNPEFSDFANKKV